MTRVWWKIRAVTQQPLQPLHYSTQTHFRFTISKTCPRAPPSTVTTRLLLPGDAFFHSFPANTNPLSVQTSQHFTHPKGPTTNQKSTGSLHGPKMGLDFGCSASLFAPPFAFNPSTKTFDQKKAQPHQTHFRFRKYAHPLLCPLAFPLFNTVSPVSLPNRFASQPVSHAPSVIPRTHVNHLQLKTKSSSLSLFCALKDYSNSVGFTVPLAAPRPTHCTNSQLAHVMRS